MKIYCTCNFCSSKIYLATTAQTRQQLASSWGVYFSVSCNSCQTQNQFNVSSVYAESSHRKTLYATAAGGGLLGVIAGPIGVFIGLTAGGITGGIAVAKENNAVRRFNSSHYF